MLIRGVAGLIIGVAYGFLVSLVVFLLTRIGLEDKPNAGLIMLDARAMAFFATVLSGIIAGVCAAIVGLIVSLALMGKRKAAITGLITGLIPIVILSGPMLYRHSSWRDWIDLLVMVVVLPVGLTLMGMLVSIVAERLSRVLL
jgi:hypothetical protein